MKHSVMLTIAFLLSIPLMTFHLTLLSSLLRDALDLDGDAARKRARLDRGACGKRRREERLVNLVHPGEIVDIAKINIALEDVIE